MNDYELTPNDDTGQPVYEKGWEPVLCIEQNVALEARVKQLEEALKDIVDCDFPDEIYCKNLAENALTFPTPTVSGIVALARAGFIWSGIDPDDTANGVVITQHLLNAAAALSPAEVEFLRGGSV